MSDYGSNQRSYESIAENEGSYIRSWFEYTAFKPKKIENEKAFVSSCAHDWFKFDTWKVGYALPILSGIEPVDFEIVWESPLGIYDQEDYITGRARTCVRLISGNLFGMMGLTDDPVCPYACNLYGRS